MLKLVFNKFKRLFLVVSIFSILTTSFIINTKASENDVKILNLDTNITVQEDYIFKVKQHIEVNLNNNHGIFVNIPYNEKTNYVKDIKVLNEKNYKISTKNLGSINEKIIRIGDPKKTLSGIHSWDIEYTIKGTKNDSKENVLSYALIGPFWEQEIVNAKTILTLPKPVSWEDAKFYSGSYGSTTNVLEDDHFQLKTTPTSIELIGKNLPKNYGVSVFNQLEDNYWQNVSYQMNYPTFLLIILLIFLAIVLFLYLKYGRDKKTLEIVEFYPPNNMDPLELSKYINDSISYDDIVAGYVYLANKGYLKIIQEDKNKFYLEKLNPINDFEPEHIKYFYNYLFKDSNRFNLYNYDNDIKSLPYDVSTKIKEKYQKYGKKQEEIRYSLLIIFSLFLLWNLNYAINHYIGLFDTYTFVVINMIFLGIISIIFFTTDTRTNPVNQIPNMILNIVIGLESLIVFFLVTTFVNYTFQQPILGMLIGLLIPLIIILISLIRCRNSEVYEIDGRIKGFKTFIKKVELNKLKMLVNENPTYFYDIIPYAYIFNLSDEWINNFNQLDLREPENIQTLSAFDIMYLNAIFEVNKTEINKLTQTQKEYESYGSSGTASSGAGSGFGGSGGGVW